MANGEKGRGTDKDFLELLHDYSANMTKKQLVLADYIAGNYKQAAFMNTKELSKASNVSESTLLRLVDTMNFSRFADFQSALQELVRSRISSLEMFNSPNADKQNILSHVISLENAIMMEMASNMNFDNFDYIVSQMDVTRKIYVLGLGVDEIYARYMVRFLCMLRNDVILIAPESESNVFSLIVDEDAASSLVLVYHFPRYHRRTYELCKLFSEKSIRMIGIIDSVIAPIIPFLESNLLVPTRYLTLIDPTAAVMTLTHALLTALIKRNPEVYKKRMEEFNTFSRMINRTIRQDLHLPFNLDSIG